MKIPKLTPQLLVAATLVLAGSTAHASVTFYDVFLNNEYLQISNAQPLTAASFFATATISYDTAGDVGSAQVATGGTGSPFALTSEPGNNFNYQPSFATQAAMSAAFPLGSPYTFSISGGNLGTQSASLNTPPAALVSAVPFLTGSSYTVLQGLNAASADTIGINGFTPVVGATDSYVFLTITRESDGVVVFQQNFLSASTTSILLAANTLAPGTAYNIELDYSSRITTADAGFSTASSIMAFEQRTEIGFTTGAVPEPSSFALALMGAGMAAALMVFQRRGSKRSA